MKTNRLFRAYNTEGVSHHHLHLAETQGQLGEWENFKKGQA